MPVHLSIADQARADLKHPMHCKPHTGTRQESLQVTDRVAACRRQLPPAVCFLLDWDSQGIVYTKRACLQVELPAQGCCAVKPWAWRCGQQTQVSWS